MRASRDHGASPRRSLNILLISTRDVGGGAEKVARDLFEAYRSRGHNVKLAVGYKHSRDADVVTIPNGNVSSAWMSFWWRRHENFQPRYGKHRGSKLLGRALHALAAPGWLIDRQRGIEDFRYPGTWRLIDTLDFRPDIIHGHNLHGGYFDLRILPFWCKIAPVVVTLHDAWMLSGHCAHPLSCDRWKSGCGQCPDLTIYPAVRRDATSFNWRRKQEIYSRSRLHAVTPSQWLMDQVNISMLGPHLESRRVIPNGIDLSVFRPGDRSAARHRLGLDSKAFILLFAANGITKNRFKDYATMREAIAKLAHTPRQTPILFLGLGEGAAGETIGDASLQFVPFETDPHRLADYYRAADVYVHAARAETFGLTIAEAMACGIPVVATAVGGIPEVLGASALGGPRASRQEWSAHEHPTGNLVPPGDAMAMATAIESLLTHGDWRYAAGASAARYAAAHFDLKDQIEAYLSHYDWAIERFDGGPIALEETVTPRPID